MACDAAALGSPVDVNWTGAREESPREQGKQLISLSSSQLPSHPFSLVSLIPCHDIYPLPAPVLQERKREINTSCVLVVEKSSPEVSASPSLSLLTTQKQMYLGKSSAKSQWPWRMKTNHMTEVPPATDTKTICCLKGAYSWMLTSPPPCWPLTPSRVNPEK